jgi:hypothetical protein
MIPVLLLSMILQGASQQPAPISPASTSAPEEMIVHGTVKDPYGAVTYARIEISAVEQKKTSSNDTQTAKPKPIILDTNPYGRYSVQLPAAIYEICASGRGFITSCRIVQAGNGGHVAVNFSLDLDPVFKKANEPADSGVMDQRLAILAGKDAINCGSVPVKGTAQRANRCARDSFKQHKAFYVRYQFQGIDSEILDGLAFDGSGAGYGVVFDSMGFSSEGLEKGASMPDGSHTVVLSCPKPLKLRKTPAGSLSCFKRSRPFLIGDSIQ